MARSSSATRALVANWVTSSRERRRDPRESRRGDLRSLGKSAKNKLKLANVETARRYRDRRAGSGAGPESRLKRSMISASRGNSRSCVSNSCQVSVMAGSEVSFS
jgi:hypothetical protein